MPGKLGDMVILCDNIFDLKREAIRNVKVDHGTLPRHSHAAGPFVVRISGGGVAACNEAKSDETLSVALRLFQNMADNLSKQPENAPGQWYVDTSCALCRLCLEEAPNLITYNRDETAVHFFKQPETPEEVEAAQRAMEVCPTLAIGNDG